MHEFFSNRVEVRRPDVSILVPARNEEATLASCLESLLAQQDVSFELIVVNDHSSDQTEQIASSFSGVRLVPADDLRAGWCGKQNALHTGVQFARGKWLLFTDADTVHLSGSLRRALDEAISSGADMLSYSPAQEVRTWWERAIMPVIFAELVCAYRPSEICDPQSQAAAANGQYLLIRREAYDAIGGHAAVRSTLLEDVELARLLKRSGRRIRFRYGGDAVRTRMYRSFRALVEGWAKNLALLFPNAASLAALRGAEFALIVLGIAAGALAFLQGRPLLGAFCTVITLVIYGNFLNRIRRAHFAWKENALAVLGLPFFSILLLRSAIYYRFGREVTWRGRQYRPSAASPSVTRERSITGA
jgi:glycosyltransferase involved in cell wall biosynthesis